MLFRNSKIDKSIRNSLLLSLILHVIIVFVLGFFIVENEQRKVRESMAIDMVNTVKNKDISMPRRVIESRESMINFNKKSEKMTMIQFKPHE
ncbi:MAG: hypothetical protein QG588_319, partial [Candidatus Poribacteria bacterium]|nr:hypothetical protein [Candidatus Poribacteria bacterium]